MKKILIGVTGGIALYKTLVLIRYLKAAKCEVKVIMTDSAKKMISKNLFAVISENKVLDNDDMFNENSNGNIYHIELTRWADLTVVVPATANIIAKLANGIADDLLSTTLLATNKNIIVVPTMNTQMWESKPFQRNLLQIKEDGVIVIEPKDGTLACGEKGKGRMEEPKIIFKEIEKLFK